MPDDIHSRITGELQQRGKDWAWLSRRLAYSTGRTGNWLRRGVPPSAFAGIAAALGQTTDWVAGVTEDRQDGQIELSPMALRLAEDFDKIKDDQARIDVFARCIAVIARVNGGT